MPRVESSNGEFDRKAEQVFRSCLEINPIEATCLGSHGPQDARLPDRSREACEREIGIYHDLLHDLSELREKDLSVDRVVDLRLARGGLTGRILRLQRQPRWKVAPNSYIDDITSGVYSLVSRDFAPALERGRSLLGRLQGVPDLFAHARENLQNPPSIFTESGILKARGCVEYFDSGLKDFIDSIEDARLQRNLVEAAGAARTAVERFGEWLESGLMARSNGDFAIGRSTYDRLLVEEFALPWSSDDLVALGQRVYLDTMREMKRVAGRIQKGKPWSKVVEDLKGIHPRERELIGAYRSEIARAREFVWKNELFGRLPRGDGIEIVSTPAFARPVFPYGAYIPPAPFEKERKGTLWVTTIDPTLPESRRETLMRGQARHAIGIQALHGAVPGHHMQLARAKHLEGHDLRFLFASPLFLEGWALYCEEVMYRSGFYDDRARLMQLKNVLWRACRVIIDVELQTGRMGFNDAVSFLVRKAHLERPNAVAEVRRYCDRPTDPICHIAGKALIEELIADARGRLGDAFDPHAFHEELLSHGTIPIDLIRLEMGIPRPKPEGGRAGRRTIEVVA